MLTGEIAQMVKGATGLDDAGLAKLSPGMEKLMRNLPRTMQLQIVAEVVKSEHCFAQVKVGDKLVFDPFLNVEKSTGAMCPEALLPVLTRVIGLWEMAPEWSESGKDKPAEIVFQGIRCLDPGLENGGVGGVIYQLRFEPHT